jgi:hypothetical protein
MQVQRLDRGDAPFALQPEFHPQQRRAEGVEQLPRQLLQFLGGTLAKADIQFEGGGGETRSGLAQDLLDMVIQILDIQAVDGFAAEIVQGAHAGNDPVAAGFGQQRAVIADAQIAVAAAEV